MTFYLLKEHLSLRKAFDIKMPHLTELYGFNPVQMNLRSPVNEYGYCHNLHAMSGLTRAGLINTILGGLAILVFGVMLRQVFREVRL